VTFKNKVPLFHLHLSNEDTSFFRSQFDVTSSIGGYLGVGLFQNFSYLASIQSDYAIIVDVSSEALEFLQEICTQIARFQNQKKFHHWWKMQSEKIFHQYLKQVETTEPNSWLLQPESFESICQLILRKRIYLIHGDLGNPEIHRQIRTYAGHYSSPIVYSYLSNILSLAYQLHGYRPDYEEIKKLLGMDCFSDDGLCCLTSEFIPKEWRGDFYHYFAFSMKNLRNILHISNTLEEFLAHLLVLILNGRQKGCSRLMEPLALESHLKSPISPEQVERFIASSSDWLIWQNYKENFLQCGNSRNY